MQRSRDSVTDQDIFRPRDTKVQSVTIKYNTRGKAIKSDKDVCAINHIFENKNVYKALVDNSGHLFNPIENKINDLNKNSKTNKFKFREIPQRSFDLYLQFLERRDNSVLLNAERAKR